MARILRGEVRWADVNPVRGHEQAGERPILVLSHDVFNDRSGTVIAVALTSQEPRAGFPLTVELKTAKLPKRSWVKTGRIRTLSTERIGRRLGRVPDEELAKVLEYMDCSTTMRAGSPPSRCTKNTAQGPTTGGVWGPRRVWLTDSLPKPGSQAAAVLLVRR